MLDFRGNEYDVGDTVIYAPTDRYAGLVEARVVEITERPLFHNRTVTTVKVVPLRESNWGPRGVRERDQRYTVKLTNVHRILKV